MSEAAADYVLPRNGTLFEAWLHVGSVGCMVVQRHFFVIFPATPYCLMPCTGKVLSPDASSVSMPSPMGRNVAQDIHQRLLSTAGEDLIEQKRERNPGFEPVSL